MIRLVHRWPGLVAGLLLLVLSLSGALLSIFPVVERLSSVQADALSTAELAERIQAVHPEVEQIRRKPSGRISAYWSENGVPQAAVMDPATGRRSPLPTRTRSSAG
jgi:sulfite reductase (NADPH) flavoprotein alpha-component